MTNVPALIPEKHRLPDWRSLERSARHAAARPLVGALRVRRDAGPVDLAAVRRTLVIRPNRRLGNLLLVTPTLTALRRALPDAGIDLLVTPAWNDLLRDHPDLDRVVTWDRALLARPWRLVGFARRLRAAGYDLAIDGSEGSSLTGALLARLCGARWTVAPRPSRYAALYSAPVTRPPGSHHLIDRLGDLLEAIGVPRCDAMKVAVDRSDRTGAAREWRDLGLDGGTPVIGVQIGARGEKRWPLAHFAEVVRGIAALGACPLILAGPEDLDRLNDLGPSLPPGVPILGPRPARRFAALLERCAVVVTGDTGPMHLAAAVGTPTVSIFLRDNHPTYAPRGRSHRCVHGTDATPQAVIDAMGELLDIRTGAARQAAG